jgi:hypothetical protein
MLNLWASFLAAEKLTAKTVDNFEVLLDLAQELAKRGVVPSRRPYKDRIQSRRLVVNAAMDLGIDLTGLKKQGDKLAMGRGLLDVWKEEYARRFGSAFGTAAWAELKRRAVVTKLAEQRRAVQRSLGKGIVQQTSDEI